MRSDKKRVVITGSTGNLGAKAVKALGNLAGWGVVRIGRNAGGHLGVIEANLDQYNNGWAAHFEGADAVLHLAADPTPIGSWASITRLNIDLTLNVFAAAERARVRRFVLASSNWVLGGYRFNRSRLTAELAPAPVNPYGASKLFIERYGSSVAERTGMSVLALRIGYCQPGENHPGPHMAFGRWGQEMWLGNRDWEQAVVKSVTSEFPGSAVLNIVSDNEGMRWDLKAARQTIGYVPKEGHRPRLTPGSFLKDRGACLREWLVPSGASEPLFGARW